MSRVFLLLVSALSVVQLCQATCNPQTLKAIKDLRQGVDDSNFLESALGEYQLVFMAMGPFSSLVSSQCFKATITKDDAGYKVVYNGIVTLQFQITYEDGAIQVIDDKGKKSYSLYVVYSDSNNKVISFYTCRSEGLSSLSFSAVAVSSETLERAKDSAKAAQEALASVGVKGGSTTGCAL